MQIQVTTQGAEEQQTAGCQAVAGGRKPDGAAAAVPLGIHARNASPERSNPGTQRVWRYALQASARELLKRERVANCLRVPYGSEVEVLHTPQHRSACFRGLQTCGSVWHCAVCASKISETRRREVGDAIGAYGGRVALATYTVRHHKGDNLGWTVAGILEARKKMRSGKGGVQFRERFGLIGSIRALEVTHGKNGWHPHIHELLFLDGEIDPQEVGQVLREQWGQAVTKAGLKGVNGYGLDLRATDLDVGQYVAKFGYTRTWGPEHEIAKAVTKRARGENRTPVDLLTAYLHGEEAAGSHWQTYAWTFKGQRQLRWSNGLRLLLGLKQERTDEQIARSIEQDSVLLARLTAAQWKCILGNDCRAEVLQIAATGDAGALWLYLRAIGVE